MSQPTILVAAHDAQLLRLKEVVLSDAGYEVVVAPAPNRAYEQIRDVRPDLFMTELLRPDPDDDLALLKRIRLDSAMADLPIIVCTTPPTLTGRVADQLRAAKCAVLLMPFTIEDMLAMVEECLRTGAS